MLSINLTLIAATFTPAPLKSIVAIKIILPIYQCVMRNATQLPLVILLVYELAYRVMGFSIVSNRQQYCRSYIVVWLFFFCKTVQFLFIYFFQFDLTSVGFFVFFLNKTLLDIISNMRPRKLFQICLKILF